jgi:hypothetical protein
MHTFIGAIVSYLLIGLSGALSFELSPPRFTSKVVYGLRDVR